MQTKNISKSIQLLLIRIIVRKCDEDGAMFMIQTIQECEPKTNNATIA